MLNPCDSNLFEHEFVSDWDDFDDNLLLMLILLLAVGEKKQYWIKNDQTIVCKQLVCAIELDAIVNNAYVKAGLIESELLKLTTGHVLQINLMHQHIEDLLIL